MRLLSWNLFHGRSVPDSQHELLDGFADALACWEWDVALLQECPPWWPASLARACGAAERHVLTSRNSLLRARRALAMRRPDLMRSSGGGCNAILVRGAGALNQRVARLCRLPERRRVQAVLIDGVWIGNLHASGPDVLAARDCARAGAALLRWAGPSAPVVLGGDTNLPAPALAGFALAGGHDVDHFLVSGMSVVGGVEVLACGPLSDHEPVAVTVTVDNGR